MPIVSHTVETTVQSNGNTHNVIRFQSSDGREFTQPVFGQPDFDLQAYINQTIVDLDEQLAQDEYEAIVGQPE